MEHFLSEIKIALDIGLYTLALVGALSLPDVCATLELSDPDRRDGVGKRYKEWYRKYAEKNCFLSDEACYLYRCSMVHKHNSQNSFPHQLSPMNYKFSKIAFFSPNEGGVAFNNCAFKLKYNNPITGEQIEDDAIVIELDGFINGMIKSVNEWLDIIKEDDNFKKNINDLIKPRPNSIINMINGGTIIY
ncbi:MAG: hypothetical protein K6G82_02265 [Ruminococcus sp.]|nr:hypothetical protein [Ruminococcus sp.]